MKFDSATMRLSGTLLGILLIIVILAACGDGTDSTSPTGNGPGDWDEYATWCSEASLEEPPSVGDITYGEASTFYAGVVETMKSTTPPSEVADWHNRYLALLETLIELIDDGPQDENIDLFAVFSDSEAISLFQEVDQALNDMPADAREQLAAAGCLGEENAGQVGGTTGSTPEPATTPATTQIPASIASDPSAMTVVEYARWCAQLPDDIFPATWGEFLEIVRPSLDAAEDLTPPTELANLHEAVLSYLQASSATASRFDADAAYDLNEIILHGLVYLGRIDEMKDDWNSDVRAALIESGCIGAEIIGDDESSATVTQGQTPTTPSEDTPTPQPAPTRVPAPTAMATEITPASPANVHYALDGSTVRVTWDPVAGADHYTVYHDDFFDSSCSVGEDGTPRFCEELASGVEATSYVHASPGHGENHYWVVACNSSGCSGVDSENPATPLVARPESPANVQYGVEGTAIRVSWDPVDGADYYKVYHDDFFDSSCQLHRDGSIGFCEELAANATGTSFVHATPDTENNYYWVVACNSGGCSAIDSENPARLTGSGAREAIPGGTPIPTTTPRSTPTPQPSGTRAPTPTVAPGPTPDTPVSNVSTSSARDRDGDGLIEVDSLAQLDAIRWDLDGDGLSDNEEYATAFYDAGTGTMCSAARCSGYELTASLDFDTNGNGEADEGDDFWNGGNGWIPIGESGRPFDTTFEGRSHTIANLYIRRSPNIGLFGVLGSGSMVSGIGLVNASVAASGYGAAGPLAGIGRGVIVDSFADGLAAGCVDQIGGLVGLNQGRIVNSRSAGNVASALRSSSSASGVIVDLVNNLNDFPLFGSQRRTCYASGGGLVGENSGTIASSHSASVVSGFTDSFGGLAGVNSGAITDSYATGRVSAKGCSDCFAEVGGLVGRNETEAMIMNSNATGGVSGQGDNFGGLAGVNSGVIAASNATGGVSGSGFANVGGLVGANEIEGKIVTSHASASVSGQGDNFGGLSGVNSGVIAASYAAGSVSGNGFANVGGLVGDNAYTGVITAAHAEGPVSGRADRLRRSARAEPRGRSSLLFY